MKATNFPSAPGITTVSELRASQYRPLARRRAWFWAAAKPRLRELSITRTQGGLGLGLAIVRHLVEVHGGVVTAESAGEGKGAKFTVDMPVRAVAASLEGSNDA